MCTNWLTILTVAYKWTYHKDRCVKWTYHNNSYVQIDLTQYQLCTNGLTTITVVYKWTYHNDSCVCLDGHFIEYFPIINRSRGPGDVEFWPSAIANYAVWVHCGRNHPHCRLSKSIYSSKVKSLNTQEWFKHNTGPQGHQT